MGCDPEAKLFFGIVPNIDDENVDLNDMVNEWQKRHVPEPVEVGDRYTSKEWEQWRQDVENWKETSPLCIRDCLYGYDDELHYAICCNKFYFSSEWDEVTIIPSPLPVPSKEHIDGLKAFCDHFDLPWQRPRWHLVSLYF